MNKHENSNILQICFWKAYENIDFIAISGPIDPFYVKFPFIILIAWWSKNQSHAIICPNRNSR